MRLPRNPRQPEWWRPCFGCGIERSSGKRKAEGGGWGERARLRSRERKRRAPRCEFKTESKSQIADRRIARSQILDGGWRIGSADRKKVRCGSRVARQGF